MDTDTVLIGVAGAVVLSIVITLFACGFVSDNNKLKCMELMKDKSAVEIHMLCRSI